MAPNLRRVIIDLGQCNVSFTCILYIYLFSVKTAEEINERLNGLKLEEPAHFTNLTIKEVNSLSTPQSMDWRKSGLVSPVQNQVRSAV